MNSIAGADGPALSLLIREKNGSYITRFPYETGLKKSDYTSIPETREDVEFSSDGTQFVGIEGAEQKVVVRNSNTTEIVSEIGGINCKESPLKVNIASFSPRASYVLAWSRPVAGGSFPNLVVYDITNGDKVSAFHQKTYSREFWPSLQWSDDESVAARCVSNIIHFFDGGNIAAGPKAKLNVPGVTSIALSRGPPPYHVGAFIAGKAGQPGQIAIYQHPDNGGQVLLQRSTFRADAVDFKWAATGFALLALVSTNVDSSGKSYYGESEVYFIHVANRTLKRIELPQAGPTYDVSWSPTGLEFVIIYGFMPARATMFNDKCDPVFDFGTGSRNTISFSPHGRFLALAGFGSLPGLVEFWDKNKTALVGTASLPCTTSHSWSPCSRYFLGATTYPRLRVDNAVRVVRVDGQLIHHHKMPDTFLLQAVFKPSLRSAYQDPKLTLNQMIGGPLVVPGQVAPTASGRSGDNSASKVYRPPGARANGGGVSFSLHDKVEAAKVDQATFMSNIGLSSLHGSSGLRPKARDIPGLFADDEKQGGLSKNAQKRKKKKEREARQASDPLASQQGSQQTSEHTSEASGDMPFNPDEIFTVEAAGKRIKAVKKKLRQIELLKSDVNGGKEINDDQKDKIKLETYLMEQLSQLEQKLEQLNLAHA